MAPNGGLSVAELKSRAGYCESQQRFGIPCLCGLHEHSVDGSWSRTPALTELFANDIAPVWPKDAGQFGGIPESFTNR